MGNKYQRDLRELVGYDRTRKVLGAARVKESIGPRRGIGYFTADRAGVASSSGDAPSDGVTGTQLDESTREDGTLNSENNTEENIDQDAEDNGAVDPKNPWRSTYDENTNVYDAEDLIDGVDAPTRYTPNDPISGLGGLDDYGNGFLKKIDGMTDCNTGTDLEVRFDGTYQPPDTWDDDGTPPLEEEFVLGENWKTVGAIGSPPVIRYGATAYSLLLEVPDIVGFSYTTLTLSYDASFAGGAGRFIGTYERAPDPTLQYSVTPNGSCVVGVDEGCPAETPTRWPSDSKMQLSLQDGKFQHSEYEPDADEVARFTDDQHSHVDFCFDGGNRFGVIATTNEGGFMVYETSSANGPPKSDTIVRIFDSEGRLTGYSDAAGISAYDPQ